MYADLTHLIRIEMSLGTGIIALIRFRIPIGLGVIFVIRNGILRRVVGYFWVVRTLLWLGVVVRITILPVSHIDKDRVEK